MTIQYEKTIPFYDVDPMRVVWHGNYIKYLEEARCAYLNEENMTYADMGKIGYAFPVVELKVKYIHPCIFGQKIRIQVDLEPCSNFLFFKYKIQDAQTGKKLCEAQTKQMCVSIDKKESLYEIPEAILKQLGIK